MIGAQGRIRTTDTGIFSPLLYQLSYLGAGRERYGRRPLAGRKKSGPPGARHAHHIVRRRVI